MLTKGRIAKELKLRRKRRSDFAAYFKWAFSVLHPGVEFQWNWHLDLISEHIMALLARDIRNLIVNIPPRTLKSDTFTVATPAFALGCDATETIAAASYSSTLSKEHSVNCRLLIEHPYHKILFPHTIITSDQNEKSSYTTTKRGHRKATSVRGTVTGIGGNFLILDDPISADDARSKTERDNCNHWLSTTWSSRGNDPRRVVNLVVMQRLHAMDPTAHFLAQGGYEHLVIPRYTPVSIYYRFPISGKEHIFEAGTTLHPERVNEDMLPAMKRRMGTLAYQAQELQTPAAEGGDRIKLSWFPRYKTLFKNDEYEEIVVSLDTAQKDKEINDPTAGLIFGRIKHRWHLLHILNERLIYPELKARVLSMAHRVKPHAILIEDKSSGTSLIQDLLDSSTLPIIAIEPNRDKASRLDVHTPLLEAGLISLPDLDHIDAPWLSDFEARLMEFPDPIEWDSLDALSQFLAWTRDKSNHEVELW